MEIVLQYLVRDTIETINLFAPKIEYDVDSLRKELLEKYKDFHIIHERFCHIRIVIYSCNKGCRYLIENKRLRKEMFVELMTMMKAYLACAIIGLKISNTVLKTSFMGSLSAALIFFSFVTSCFIIYVSLSLFCCSF